MDTHILPQSTAHTSQYTKHDLAMAYFPTLKAAAAERKLRRWINENPYLIGRLKMQKYNKFCKTLTPNQLRAIISVLGHPEADIFASRSV